MKISNLINYFYRAIMTYLGYFFFGLGAALLSFILFPIILTFLSSPLTRKKYIRSSIHNAFKLFIIYLNFTNAASIKIMNAELVKEDKGAIIIANHPTLIDIVILISIYENATCIVKESLLRNWFVKKIILAANYIPNNPADELIEKTIKSFKDDDVLIIFPEGTRTTFGKEIDLKRGAAHLALQTHAPVRCIKIKCNQSTLNKENPWYAIPPKKVEMTISLEEKVLPSSYDHNNERSREARKLTNYFKDLISY